MPDDRQAPPAGIVGWLIVDDKGRHALRLDEAAALQYAAEHHGVVWPVVARQCPCGASGGATAGEQRSQATHVAAR